MVASPTEIPGMEVRLRCPDMPRSLLQTKSECECRERTETAVSHDVRLVSLSLRMEEFKQIEFSNMWWAWKILEPFSRERIADWHSIIYLATLTQWGWVYDWGMWLEADRISARSEVHQLMNICKFPVLRHEEEGHPINMSGESSHVGIVLSAWKYGDYRAVVIIQILKNSPFKMKC